MTTHGNCFHVPKPVAQHMVDISREDARRRWTEDPRRRLLAELYCIALIFVPHPYNNNARKALTLILFVSWAAIEIGAAFGVATLPPQFVFVRGLVLILLGRMWGLELNNFAGVEFTSLRGDDDEE